MNISVTQNVQKFLDCINKSGPLVGFDLGTKTIGVAISDESRTIASPVVVIKRKKFSEDLEKIKDLEKKYQFTGIILGLPINMNGTEGPRCQSTRSFASKISLLLRIVYVCGTRDYLQLQLKKVLFLQKFLGNLELRLLIKSQLV